MNSPTLFTLGLTLLALDACGGSSGGAGTTSSSTPPPSAPTVLVSGVLEGSGGTLSLNQRPLDFSKARLTLDGQPVAASAVKPGMPIAGSASDQQGTLVVAQAETHVELQGSLDAVDHDTLRLLGQQVRITGGTLLVEPRADGDAEIHLQDLRARDSLRVFGLRSGGLIQGTRVERGAGAGAQAELRGTVQGLQTSAFLFFLNGTQVDYRNAQVVGVLAAGAQVDVHGSLAAGVLVADRVVAETSSALPELPEAELHGAISALNTTAMTFQMLGITIDYKTAVVVGTLADGSWAEVHAVQTPGQPAGQLSATRVTVEPPAPPATGGEREGSIDFLDPAAGLVGVGGTRFWTDPSTVILMDDQPAPATALKLGLSVEIHFDPARTNPAGLAYAFRIEIDAESETEHSGAESQAEGVISGFDPLGMQFMLGAVTVKATPTTVYQGHDETPLTAIAFWASSRDGAKAEARGTLVGTTLTATRIELK